MYDLQFKFPMGWQLIVIVVLGVAIFCAIRWRGAWRGMLAILSLMLFLGTAITLPITWMSDYDAQIIWSSGSESNMSYWWNLNTEVNHGIIIFRLTEDHVKYKGFPIHFSMSHENNHGQATWINGPRSLTRDWPWLEKLGFQLVSVPPNTSIVRVYSIAFPHYFVLLLCLPFPLIWFRRFRRQRYRRLHNFCLACGFNRQAHQPTDACPECGLIPKLPKTTTTPPSTITSGSGGA